MRINPYAGIAGIALCGAHLNACGHSAPSRATRITPASSVDDPGIPALGREDIAAGGSTATMGVSPEIMDAAIRANAARALSVTDPVNFKTAIAVAVVVTPKLPDGTIATVVRRARAWPANVILLEEGGLTVGRFENGMRAITREVAKTGERPSSDVAIQLHGAGDVELWHNTPMEQLAKWELDTLRSLPLRRVEGIGPARAMVVHLAVRLPPPAGR